MLNSFENINSLTIHQENADLKEINTLKYILSTVINLFYNFFIIKSLIEEENKIINYISKLSRMSKSNPQL